MDAPFPALEAGPVDGPLVLLLHGFPKSKAAWDRVLPLLADGGCRAVAFDQRGYRPETDAGGDRRLPALAGDVLTMADALGADRFHVVGHDWGGAVAWQLAADEPGRVASVSIVATPHPRALLESAVGMQALRSSYVGLFRLPLLPEVVLRARGGLVLQRMLRRSGLDEEHAATSAAAMLEDGVLSGALGWYRQNGMRELRGVGPSLVPTLYVWPSRDVALGRRAAERTEAHVHGAYRFEVLEGCSHWVPETRPAELARLVLDHVGANPA